MTAGAYAAVPPRQDARAWQAGFALAAVAMMATYSQGFVFPVFGDGPRMVAAGGLIRLMFFPAYAVGLALIASAPLDTLRAVARQPFLILVLALVAVSLTWSVSPDQTARRAFAVYLTTLSGVGLAVRFRWGQLAEVLALMFAILGVLSLGVCLALPSMGRMPDLFPGAWRGLWAEKNAFGGNMALGVVVLTAAAALNPRRARLWGGLAVLLFGLVLTSTSKTALVSVMLGLGALGMTAFAQLGPAAGVLALWLTVCGVMLVAGVALFAADAVFGLLGKDATLTGRTKIWSAAMRQIADRPWTGFGYGAIWTEEGRWGPLARIIKDAGFRPQHAHNTWIEQWLGQGLPGLVAFALAYLQALALAAVAVFRSRGALLAVPYLVVYTPMTFTESVGLVYNDMRWVMFVAIAVKLAWPDQDERSGG
jgi:exopolysaccharide production protein ExoQ